MLDLAERVCWTGLALGLLAAALFVALNDLAPLERPWTFGLVLGGAYLLVGLASALVALPLLLGAARFLGLARARLALAGLGGALALTLLWANARVLMRVGPPGGPGRFRWLVPAVIVLSAVLAALAGLWPERRRGVLRILAVATLGLGAIAVWPPALRGAVRLPAASAQRPATPALIVVGLDGADWEYAEPLIAQGQLPNLAALRARGAWGPLATEKPTLSPVVWTTLATGYGPERHGIRAFTFERLKGVGAALPRLRPLRGLGLRQLPDALRQARFIDDAPVTSSLRRVPAFWNIATANGSPVAVVNWWATWPAEAVLGAVVSERVYYRPAAGDAVQGARRLTFPEELLEELRPLMLAPRQVRYEDARRFMDVSADEFARMQAGTYPAKSLGAQAGYFLAMSETDRRVALHLLERGRRAWGQTDLLVLFRLIDMVSHTSLQHSELVTEHLDSTPEDLQRYGRVVSEAYRSADRALGELIAQAPGAHVLVVSDHGFRLERQWPQWEAYYGHGDAPPGIFVLAGPSVKPGRRDDLGVRQVAPLMLRLKDLPLPPELAGALRDDVLTDEFRAGTPLRLGTSAPTGEAGAAPEAGTGAGDEELMERLRALGYVQ